MNTTSTDRRCETSYQENVASTIEAIAANEARQKAANEARGTVATCQ